MSDIHLDDRVYDVIGEAGFARLCEAFFLEVRQDEVLSGIYPMDDLEGAEFRLREFLVQRFGGPHRYSQQRGHPRLRARHMPYAIDQKARDHWVQAMEKAMQQAELGEDVQAKLRPFFDDAATFMINRD